MNEQAPSVGGFISRASQYVAEGLRYWEPRRLFYNAIMGIVVVAHVVATWPDAREALTLNTILFLFFMAVLANVCYCAVYAVDLFVRFSGLESAWQKGRVVVLVIGTAFAGVIAHFFSTAMFPSH